MNHLLSLITSIIISLISTLGYPGLFLLMAVQCMAIPVPSEVILPFAGFLAVQGRFSLLGIVLVGALGSVAGASFAYYIGHRGGRPLVKRYGKYILISENDLALTEKFFARFGSFAVFMGQVLPIVRSFIGFVAGVAQVPYKKFVLYTFIGSVIWSLLLAFIGMKLGENWATLRDKLHGFDTAIVILIVLGAVFWVYRHFKHSKVEAGNTVEIQ